MEEFTEIVAEHNGKNSIYTSHNSYPGANGAVRNAEYVNIKQVFFDIDSSKLENALLDARTLCKWFDEQNLPYTVAFSGKKGFQVLLQLEPEVYSLREKIVLDQNTSYTLTDYYRAVYAWLSKKLELRCLDAKCAEPRRVCRIWNTSHFNLKTKVFTGTFCVPLSPSQLYEWSVKDVLEWAVKPRMFGNDNWNTDRKKINFHQFVEEFNIDPHMTQIEFDPEGMMIDEYIQSDSTSFAWLKGLFPHACVHNSLYNSNNPPHVIRFAMAVWLKKMNAMAPVLTKPDGSQYKICPDMKFVDNFYRRSKFIDWENHEERWYQINNVWSRNYEMPSCKVLYSSGVCIGDACPLFNQFLRPHLNRANERKRLAVLNQGV